MEFLQAINIQRVIALSFHKDNILLFCGLDSGQIKIYMPINGEINLIASLEDHYSSIYKIISSKVSNFFISCGGDSFILIWNQFYTSQQWDPFYKLEGHSQPIYGLLLNNNETEIISSSQDGSIIVWNCFSNNWIQSQVLIFNQHNSIFQIDYNKDQSQFLAMCGYCKLLVYQKSPINNMWKLQQTIQTNQDGFSACFLENQYIVAQPRNKGILQLFHCYQNSMFLLHSQEIIGVKNDWRCFSLIYNSKTSSLYAKCYKQLCILKFNSDIGKLKLQQVIQMEDSDFAISFSNQVGEPYIQYCNYKLKVIKIKC